MMNRLRKILNALSEPTNWPKTIWFNFRFLPLKQAKKLPILLYRNVDCGECMRDAKIILSSHGAHFGRWRIGINSSFHHESMFANCITRLAIRGTMELGNGSIVGCNSFVNKDYSDLEIGVFAEIPARLIK